MEHTQDEVLTPEDLIEIGKEFSQECLDLFTRKENLPRIELEQLTDTLSAKEYIAGLSLEQLMVILSPEQRMAGLSPEQIIAGLPPEQIMEGLAGVPQQYLFTYLDPDEMAESEIF